MTDREKRLTANYLNRIKITFFDDLMELKSYWCRYAMLDEHFNRSLHHHTFYELHYCFKGSAGFSINGQEIELTANRFLLIPPLTEHQILRQSRDFEKFVFGFEIQFNKSHEEYAFHKKAFDSAIATKCYADTETMRTLPELILNYCLLHYENMYSGITCALRLLIHEISTLLLPNAIKQESVLSIEQLKKNCFWSDRIDRYIVDNIANKLTANDISQQFHISAQQLNRILMSEIHMTVAQLIAQKKFEAVSDLLEGTPLLLHDIAAKTGFSNEYNLNRFFKSQSGMAPGKYRKSIVKNYTDK